MSDVAIDDLMELVKAKLRRLSQSPLHIQKPLTDKQLETANSRLPYPAPYVLVTLYREIGNGGFGPYYGLLGLAGGWADDRGRDATQVYEWLREEDDGEDLLPGDELCDPVIPEYLLPVCHLGCGVYVCLDCREPEARIWTYDPAQDMDQLTDTGQPFKAWLSEWAG